MMSLPWWLESYSSDDVGRVLRALVPERRLQLQGADADIASRLLRNGYVRAVLQSTIVGVDVPLALELRSHGLTDLGRALLAGLGAPRTDAPRADD